MCTIIIHENMKQKPLLSSIRSMIKNLLVNDYCFSCVLVVSCRDPGTPANGIVLSLTNGIAAGSVVTYGCNQGYILVGAGSRVCRANGVWSVKLPICKGQCYG